MTTTSNLNVIIIAAGSGTRMKSDKPKMLHTIANKPMLFHILDQVKQLDANIYLVYGHKGETLQAAVNSHYTDIFWVHQEQQLGTAHAVNCAAQLIENDYPTIVLFSDNPLIQASSLRNVLQLIEDGADLSILTCELDNPFGYGRIERDAKDNVKSIVEEKDASEIQRSIKEVYPGTMCCRAQNLRKLLNLVDNKNAQKEYYLPDIVKHAYAQQQRISTIKTSHKEVYSANNKYQIAILEEYYQEAQIKRLTEQGLILRSTNPASFQLRGELEFGMDCEIDINCIFNGNVQLGNNVKIGMGCIITDSVIEDNVVIEPYTIIEKSHVGVNCSVGPFARLRPNSIICENAKVGNFVETKNTKLGKGSKANHLTYLGDSTVGEKCNIGAGVITCNYDGANKFKTVIGDNVFVGSDVQLIAPVKLDDGVTIGAGTTVTRDVTANTLIYNKKEVITKFDWERPQKN